MGLSRYNAKRDFRKTSEPEGTPDQATGALRFVIQKHAASHLHYDFRLEIDGVLVSWAVPKGPSLDPTDRRLAMHVEDHPIDYMQFEGTISKGEYGGGTVMVWDIGTYRPEGADRPTDKDTALMKKQLRERSIKIVLEGTKLQGSWHLFEMKEEQWLLMKADDTFARKKGTFDETSVLTGRDFDAIAAGNDVWHSNRKDSSAPNFTAEDVEGAEYLKTIPDDWRPQKATLSDAPFDHPDWIFEPKYDGYRAFARLQQQKVALISRNGLSFNKKYPEIISSLPTDRGDMLLDGEVVVEDDEGRTRFQWLQHYEDTQKGTLRFYVFDILYFGGYDLRNLDLMRRKKILEAVLPVSDRIRLSPYTEEKGTDAYRKAEKAQAEGIIAKRKSSRYVENKRSKDWLKIKTKKPTGNGHRWLYRTLGQPRRNRGLTRWAL
ncbi:DNA polymerase ligase N-terminal domain-containing protein [Flavobacterium sp. N1718]|uniref:DNA polymerase ligase N-terminal domain-containing protein n=1 Tax=Flavobacterium sp. N1718 TaxID=2986822 RepID=UPI002224CE9F|nr:DNA polymerase ligase N-terminal domain-containing protein [Flavobacterium sp. N1718]